MKNKYIYLMILIGGVVLIAITTYIAANSESITSLSYQPVASNKTTNATFTKEEVAVHNKKMDCYLIVNDQVYDVTKYIDKHPGGARKIVEMCGQESSQIFAAIHSNFAWNLLADYYIGDIVK